MGVSRRGDRVGWSGEDVDNDRRGMDALIHGIPAGGFNGLQPVIGHSAQDLDHLPAFVIAALQLAPDRGHGRWQNPVLERGTVARAAPGLCARTGT